MTHTNRRKLTLGALWVVACSLSVSVWAADEIDGLVSGLGSTDAATSGRAANDLERLCSHAGRAGAEKERRALVMDLLKKLDPDVPVQARIVLIEQIGMIGKYEAVKPLGKILADDSDMAVREAARRALENIPVVTVKKAFQEALPKAEGKLRIGILRSMGIRRDFRGVELIMKAAGDEDIEVRLAAIEALALIGEISAVPVVENALESTQGISRQRVLRAYLRLADALVDNSEKGTARRIYIRAMELGTAARCAALRGFARAGLQSEVQRIVDFSSSENSEERAAALEAAVIMPGPRMTKALVARLDKAEEAAERRPYLRVLARRRDKASTAKLIALAGDEQGPAERACAVRLLGGVAPWSAPPRADMKELLPTFFGSLEGPPELRDAAVAALIHAPGQATTAAVGEQVAATNGGVRATLLSVLGARGDTTVASTILAYLGDEDVQVRLAAIDAAGRLAIGEAASPLIVSLGSASGSEQRAIEQALSRLPAESVGDAVLVAAREASSGSERVILVRVLGRLRDPKSIPFLEETTKSTRADERLAALQGVALSPDPSALPILESFLSNGTIAEKQVALEGALRHATLLQKSDRERALRIDEGALELDPDEYQVRVALSGIAEVGGPEQLASVMPFLAPGALQRDAGRTALRLAERLAEGERDRAVEILQKVVRLDVDEATATQAVNRLRKLGVELDLASERGFITHWFILGPIPDPVQDLWDRSLEVERTVELSQPVTHAKKTFKWNYYHTPSVFGHVLLERAGYGRESAGAYLYAEVTVPEATEALLKIGSDDHVACWLNGEKVHANKAARRLTLDQDTVKVQLNEGTNRILLKIINVGGDWGSCLRITDLDGKPLAHSQRKGA